MKKLLLRTLFILIPFLYSIYASAQPKHRKDCSATCFSTEVLSVEKRSERCTTYELRVSFAGNCAHALSHFTVGIPCGNVENLWNSQDWAQVIGTDPTTGLTGFKIDNIPGFGESSLQSFTVKFDLCGSGESCQALLDCWQPQVAYKASTCVNFETLNVTCKTLQASLSKQDVSCFGAADGSLSVVIEEGQEPYAYLWSQNSNTSSISGLTAGDYSVVVKDASGAEIILQESVLEPEKISITGTKTDATCEGASDGAIELTVSGGAGGYSYLWSNGMQTKDLSSLSPGSYSVKVTDANNCSVQQSFMISGISAIQITDVQTQPACNSSTGAINISVSGGASPYSFRWSYNNLTVEDLTGVPEGRYVVTVTDKNGCTGTGSYYLLENSTLALSGSATSSSCTSDATGSINLQVEGGTEPYQYSWSNEATSEDLSNLPPGDYTVTVTDKNGCQQERTFKVSKSTFFIVPTVVQPLCHGDANGSITLQDPISGVGPFTYEWGNGETGTELTGLGAGSYKVTVYDNTTGCSREISITLRDPSEISASALVSNTGCNDGNAFAVDLTVSGGRFPYTYKWSDGSESEDLTGLERGPYSVIITDQNGCTASHEVVVEGDISTWNCLISDPGLTPVCNAANNKLSTPVVDADSYVWTVESTDGNWSVSQTNAPSTLFTAGGENSSATFTLTIEKDGCIKTCTYAAITCITGDEGGETDPPGEEDPGEGGNDTGDETCQECFDTNAELLEVAGNCRTYEMVVSTNGLCRHDLSHWTLAVPCGNISAYSNSEGWKMELGKDPTTGLYGLKVDDINDFGKSLESFIVRFTVCNDNGCDLASWNPTVAYKAGLCVGFEKIAIAGASSAVNKIAVYPNPFDGQISFEWSASTEEVTLQIIDQYGNTVSNVYAPGANKKTEGYSINLQSGDLPKGMYYYRLTVDGKTHTGKITKR